MNSPIILQRQSNDQQEDAINLNPATENSLLLYIYRRKIQKSFSKNLNQIVNITHPTHTDNGILDYYSNNYDSNNNIPQPQLQPQHQSQPQPQPQSQPQPQPQHQPQPQPQFQPQPQSQPQPQQIEPVNEDELDSELELPDSPHSIISKGNRNYFIYAKTELGNLKNNKRDTSNRKLEKLHISKNINSDPNKPNSNIVNNFLSNFNTKSSKSSKSSKLSVSQISSPITSPSDSIYNNQKAYSLASTSTRIIPPVPSYSLNNHVQQKETLRGPQITPEDDLFAPYTFNTTITAHPFDNHIIEDYNEMNKDGNFNKIIINKTTEEVIHSLVPINGNNKSNFI